VYGPFSLLQLALPSLQFFSLLLPLYTIFANDMTSISYLTEMDCHCPVISHGFYISN
jgi:hypothetical protein